MNTENNPSFKELFEASRKERTLSEGSDLLVEVLDVNENYVTVNAALKSDAHIATEEFLENGNEKPEIGDTIEVEIEMLENGMGETVLSRRNARRKKMWEQIELSMNGDEVVEGVVQGRVRGGYSVALDGLRAFLPGSLADIFPTPAIDDILIGKVHQFKPIKFNRRRNSVILSRRAVIEQKLVSSESGEILGEYTEGTRVTATVRAIVDYGAFLEINPNVFGLLHITDISWKHTESINDLMNIGDELEVVILRVDIEKNRISLGMKQLQPDPWEYFENIHPVGSRTYGKITKILDYGAFVEIEGNLQGLVHMSEISWSRRNVHPSKILTEGEEVEVMILEIDRERRRISLGIKQCYNNPWQEFAIAYRKGDKIKYPIRSINEFGIFVALPGDIEGLVRVNDISFDEKGAEAIRHYSKDQEIEVVILSIDPENYRIGLGIKQIGDEGFEQFVEEHLKGSQLEAKVICIEEKGAIMETIPHKLRAFLPLGEFSEQRIDNLSAHLKEEEVRTVSLIDIDYRNKRAIVSMKTKDRQDRKASIKSETAGTKQTQLGAMLEAARSEQDDHLSKDSKDSENSETPENSEN